MAFDLQKELEYESHKPRKVTWGKIEMIYYCEYCRVSSGPVKAIQHGTNSFEYKPPEGWVHVWKGWGGWRAVCPTCPHKGQMRSRR